MTAATWTPRPCLPRRRDPGGALAATKPRGLMRRGWEVFAENRLALASLGLLVFIVLFCFVGPH